MFVLALIEALLTVLTVCAGVLAHQRGWSVRGGPTCWGGAAGRRWGPVRGTVVVGVAGWTVTVASGLAMGFLAKALERTVDRPTFDWVHARVHENLITRVNAKLTMMGNVPIVELVVLVATIILACAYKRRWWLAVVTILGALLVEKYLQRFLGKVVDRGHPPTSLGTFPSGGVGRILAVYSAVVVLVIFLIPALSRAWRAGLWAGLATAAVVEGCARVYLSQHWLTDVLFGLVFGALLLFTNIAAVSAANNWTGNNLSRGRGERPALDELDPPPMAVR